MGGIVGLIQNKPITDGSEKLERSIRTIARRGSYSKEKYSRGDKMLHYQVIPMDISINIKSHDEKRVNPIVISFD